MPQLEELRSMKDHHLIIKACEDDKREREGIALYRKTLGLLGDMQMLPQIDIICLHAQALENRHSR